MIELRDWRVGEAGMVAHELHLDVVFRRPVPRCDTRDEGPWRIVPGAEKCDDCVRLVESTVSTPFAEDGQA